MELTTHFISGLAFGFLVFHRPELAFLIALGATLPDLDREYWFIPQKRYREEQLHRALFHNIFLMAGMFLLSPFLALGFFIHAFEDSFTTVRDRGVEWLYPLTRKVKLGLYDSDGNPCPVNPKEHIYLYQEEPKALVDYAAPDLREDAPVPWRRTYGFALNGGLFDRGILIGSIALLAAWFLVPTATNAFSHIGSIMTTSNLADLANYLESNVVLWALGFGSIAMLFASGELDRRDKAPRLPKLASGSKFLKYPFFVIGIAMLGAWFFYYRVQMASNVVSFFSNYILIAIYLIIMLVSAIVIILWQTKLFRSNATV